MIAYDAAARTTRLTVGDTTTEVAGTSFMRATWRLWFDEAVPAALADALIASSPSP